MNAMQYIQKQPLKMFNTCGQSLSGLCDGHIINKKQSDFATLRTWIKKLRSWNATNADV